jgi:hypothetical protein
MRIRVKILRADWRQLHILDGSDISARNSAIILPLPIRREAWGSGF